MRHLNHATFITLMSRLFLNHIMNLHRNHKSKHFVCLTHEVKKNLHRLLVFLNKAKISMSINDIINLQLSNILITYSCDQGMCGFYVDKGSTFQCEIPDQLRF